jgi:hypothetical protein
VSREGLRPPQPNPLAQHFLSMPQQAGGFTIYSVRLAVTGISEGRLNLANLSESAIARAETHAHCRLRPFHSPPNEARREIF